MSGGAPSGSNQEMRETKHHLDVSGVHEETRVAFGAKLA